MVKHFNTTIAEDSARIFNFKGDNLSVEVMPNIQPTIEIKRYCDIVRQTNATNVTSQTIFTTPADKDFYLTSCALGVMKDALNASTVENLQGAVAGVGRVFLSIPSITLTAQTANITQTFDPPIKLDRASTIDLASTSAVATIRMTGCITGYTVETTKSTN